ncbi:MAG: hypothetical protein WDN24_01380 [Sphingomonas sp.]
MDRRLTLARELEDRAIAAATIAEAQALRAQADRLRGSRPGWSTRWSLQPLFRN